MRAAGNLQRFRDFLWTGLKTVGRLRACSNSTLPANGYLTPCRGMSMNLIGSFACVAGMIASLSPSATFTPTCIAAVTETSPGSYVLNCLNPCDAYCQTGFTVIGSNTYSYCKCTGGSEELCCHIVLIFAGGVPLPAPMGGCSDPCGYNKPCQLYSIGAPDYWPWVHSASCPP